MRDSANTQMMSFILTSRSFKDANSTRQYLNKLNPEPTAHATDEDLEEFSKREPVPLGRFKEMSQYYSGDKVVVLGDAAHAFPVSGTGVYAATHGANIFLELMKIYGSE